MRVEFTLPAERREFLAECFGLAVAEPFGMKWRFWDAGTRKRVAVLVGSRARISGTRSTAVGSSAARNRVLLLQAPAVLSQRSPNVPQGLRRSSSTTAPR